MIVVSSYTTTLKRSKSSCFTLKVTRSFLLTMAQLQQLVVLDWQAIPLSESNIVDCAIINEIE